MDELREKYLQGKLNQEERAAFESELTEKERQELAFELGVREGVRELFLSDLRSQVSDFESGSRNRSLNPTIIGIAASIFIASAFLFYFLRPQESLFETYYEVYPNYELTTTRGEEATTDRQKAYLAYDQGSFAKAINEFNQMESLVSADYFFRGICYIQVSDYERALDDFTNVIGMNDPNYKESSTWYSALIYLKLEENEMAKQFLQKLSNGTSTYASKSSALLDQL